jgi:hypothetical protein
MKEFKVFLVVLLVFGCSQPEKDQKILERSKKKFPDQESFNVEYFYSDSGKVVSKVIAKHVIEKTEKKESVRSRINILDKGVIMIFYNPQNMQEDSRLSADGAIVYPDIGYAEAKGNVEVTNAKGEKLETEKLIWNREKDIIFTDAVVRITTPEELIIGQGMEADTRFTKYTLHKVTGILKIKE